MAHNLEIRNGDVSFASTKTTWHQLGKIVDGAMTAEQAIRLANLDYTVIKAPLLANVEGVGQFKVPEKYATVRTDTNEALGVVGSKYSIIQNTEAFTFFDEIIEAGQAVFETAGVLGRGERIFISAKLPQTIRIAGTDDLTEVFVLLTSSHDGSGSILAAITPQRVVCENTLNSALKNTISKVSIRHTKNAESKLKEAHKLLGISKIYVNTLNEQFNYLSKKYVSDAVAKKLIEQLFQGQKRDSSQLDAAESTRVLNIRNKVWEAYQSGKGQKGIVGSAWGLYNGVTFYLDNVKTYTNSDQRFESIMNGSSYNKANEAFSLLMAM